MHAAPIRSRAGGSHDPPDTEAAGEGSVNLTEEALRESAMVLVRSIWSS
jgi:hypothetical protein